MDIEKYKEDIQKLSDRGILLLIAMQIECADGKTSKLEETFIANGFTQEDLDKAKKLSMANHYQAWYSEALICIKQLMPDRLADFTSYYRYSGKRTALDVMNYSIEDYLNGLSRSSNGVVIAGPNAALTKFFQQVNIIKALRRTFQSSLFNIRSLVQADVYDNELSAAQGLLKQGHLRAAGALAGVVLEGHLFLICQQHSCVPKKKDPSISEYNDSLKEASVLEIPEWRKIQHLGDIRNLCDHKKPIEPTKEQVQDLIDGTARVIKNVF